jgi:hypothetical protein
LAAMAAGCSPYCWRRDRKVTLEGKVVIGYGMVWVAV